jgi:Flp pilus assembly protein TadD
MRKQMTLMVLLALYLAACQTKPTQPTSFTLSGTQTEESTVSDVQPTQAEDTTDNSNPLETSSQMTEDLVCGSGDNSAVGYYNRALRMQQSGDWDEAKTLYSQAIEIDPDFCDAMDNLGLILRKEGDVAGAIEWYLRSIDLAPHNTTARQNLAVAYDIQGNTSLAIEQYEAIMDIDPRNPESYYGLASIYMDQERYEEAVPLFRKAVEWYEVSGSFWVRDAYHGLGISLAAIDECEEAVENLDRVYDEFIYDPWVNYNLGYCYLSEPLYDAELADLYIARASFLGMELPEDIWSYLPSWDLQIGDDLWVIYGYFGIFEMDSQGGFFFPTDQVPYREGLEYGWMMFVETERSSVRWREEFQLPTPPQSWGTVETDGYTTISADGRTAITDFRSELLEPIIGNSWILVNGDPLGVHEMRIYVEGEYVTTFEFVVGVTGDIY